MQTFLPYPRFYESLSCLDDKRLGKQRVEAYQILAAIRGADGWSAHPVTQMWRGYEEALTAYMNVSIWVWKERGFRNNMAYGRVKRGYTLPDWLGDERLHASHRGNLLRKDRLFYSRYGWTDSENLEYFWPGREL